jgi:FkbM family methyltransferase
MLSTAAKIRIARILYRVIHAVRLSFGGEDRVRVRRRGVAWELDLREGIDLTIYALGAFEIPTLWTLQSLVEKGATVLDVGANIGAHTLHLARLVGDRGRVIAFEPTDYAMAKLRANLKANPSLESRVEVHQAFLVARAEQALMGSLASSWPVDGTAPDDAQMGSRAMAVSGAKAVTLDSVMEALGNPRVQLIKMDIDGHELEVLKGGQSTIARHRPIIVMELAPYVFHPVEKFDEMVNLLVRANYGFHPLGSARELPRDPVALRALISREASVNVVAFPVREEARNQRVE